MVSNRRERQPIETIPLGRYVAMGALRHGLFMTVIVTLLLELVAGTTLDAERLLSRGFLLRTGLCLLVFGASGAISSYARWRSRQALFGKTPGRGA
jgi:hypothetical protein